MERTTESSIHCSDSRLWNIRSLHSRHSREGVKHVIILIILNAPLHSPVIPGGSEWSCSGCNLDLLIVPRGLLVFYLCPSHVNRSQEWRQAIFLA